MAPGLSLLVPYNKSSPSLRGLEAAFRIAKSEKNSRVYAVYVVEVERRLSVDAEMPEVSEEGERSMAEAEEMARRSKLKCEGDILQARDAGHAIVDQAVERGVHAIVLGVARGGRESNALDLGKTAEYVLRHAPCEVIVVREGAPG